MNFLIEKTFLKKILLIFIRASFINLDNIFYNLNFY